MKNIIITALILVALIVPSYSQAYTEEELRDKLIALLLEKVQLLQEKLALMQELEEVSKQEPVVEEEQEPEIDMDILQLKCSTNWRMPKPNTIREECKNI